jgi:hypothetical protein
LDAAGLFSIPSEPVSSTTLVDSRPPDRPINLVATVAGANQINLTWDIPFDDVAVTRYRMERCQSSSCGGSDFAPIVTIAATTLPSFSDTISLSSGTTYKYQIRALDAADNISGPSDSAIATTNNSGGSTYQHRRAITINAAQLPSPQQNFPC